MKTKTLLREKVWFPLLDKMVEETVKSCVACQVSVPTPQREPLQMSPLPEGPWQELSADFGHVNGQLVLVVTDDYSRYPLIEFVSSTSAEAVIPKLHAMFAQFGTPEVLRTDNGAPFNGDEFRRFADVLGFHHRKVTPLWSRANGEVERFIKTMRKVVKTAQVQHRNWKKEIQTFLMNYRTTPHTTTGVPPGEAFLGRKVRNKLPSVKVDNNQSQHTHEEMAKRDAHQKAVMKRKADGKTYVKPSNLKPGDTVLVKRPYNMSHGNTPYEEMPYTVTARKGSMVSARNDHKSVTRNSSFFKPLYGAQSHMNYDDNDEEERMSEHDSDNGHVPDVPSTSHRDPTPGSPPRNIPATPQRKEQPQAIPIPIVQERQTRQSTRKRQAPAKFKDYISH